MSPTERQAFVSQLVSNWESAELSAADRTMLSYAVAVTRSPATVGAADVERLRDAGFDDRAIHDICAITAYYAFVNRIADGLGVELEARFDPRP